MPAPRQWNEILSALADEGVDFAVVGGMAAISHGSATPTFDLDVCYARTVDNVEHILTALAPFHPRTRGGSEPLDERWLLSGLPVVLQTRAGPLDLLARIPGLGELPQFRDRCDRFELFGLEVLVLSLDDLIASKRASGRPKDLAVLAELEEIRRQLG